MQGEFAEKRKYPRLDFPIPMRYRKIEANSREFKGSLVRNISLGGTRMTTYEFLPLNSKLVMEMPLVSGKKSVKGVCRVAWVKKTQLNEQYDAGLEFVNLDSGDPAEIARFVIFNSAAKVKV